MTPKDWRQRGRGKGQASGGAGEGKGLGQEGWSPVQGVWRVRSRSLNFTLGPRKLLTKVSGERDGWVHTGSAGAGNQGDRS